MRTGGAQAPNANCLCPRTVRDQCSVRANGRVREQPMSATKHGQGQSVNRHRQGGGTANSQEGSCQAAPHSSAETSTDVRSAISASFLYARTWMACGSDV